MSRIDELMAEVEAIEAEVEAIEAGLGLAPRYQGCETCGEIYLGTSHDPCPHCGTVYDRPALAPRGDRL